MALNFNFFNLIEIILYLFVIIYSQLLILYEFFQFIQKKNGSRYSQSSS